MIAVGNVEGLREGKQHEKQEEKKSGEMGHGGPSRAVAERETRRTAEERI